MVPRVAIRYLNEKYWRPDIALLVGALALSAVIIGLNAVTLRNLREDTLRSVEANMESQSIVLAEESDRSFRAVDLALATIAEHIARMATSDSQGTQDKLRGRDIHELLRERRAGLLHVDAISLVDAQGMLVNTSGQWPIPEIDTADRDYFRAFRPETVQMFIGAPAHDSVTGTRTIYVARRVNAPNGDFLGVVLGAISLGHFERFFGSISTQEGSAVALVREDGMLLARYPLSKHVGEIIPVVANRSRERSAFVRRVESPVDSQLRIVSVRPVAHYPLTIAVSQTEEGALQSWRTLANHSNTTALLRTCFVLLMAWAASRWWRKQRQLTQELRLQNLRFDTALNNMSQGLCFFDGSRRLIVCNNRYIEMYGLDPARIRPGITLQEIVDLRFEAGSFPAMSREEYLAWRDRIAVSDSPSDTIVELRDGRTFEIHHRPMPDGGWVATHDDISDRQQLNTRLEQNLRLLGDRTSLLQAIIDNFPGGIGFFDRDLRVVICNDRAKRILDLPEQLFANGPPLLEDMLRFNALRENTDPETRKSRLPASWLWPKTGPPITSSASAPMGPYWTCGAYQSTTAASSRPTWTLPSDTARRPRSRIWRAMTH